MPRSKQTTNNRKRYNPRSRYWGLFARIAEELGFSRAYVSMVAAGIRRNPAIAARLRAAARHRLAA